MVEDWDSWASIIRSCVLTSKTPLSTWEINRDTKMLEGKDIPFRQLNCRSLEELLRKIPGLKVFQINGKTVVQAIPTEETAHIMKMVRLQKSSKKKRTLPPIFNRFNVNNNRRPGNYRPSPSNANKYVPQNKYSAQSRFNNVPNNRPQSTEPMKRPAPPAQSQRTSPIIKTAQVPTPNLRTPTPLLTPPPTPVQKTVHFSPTPVPLMQQRVTPPPNAQALPKPALAASRPLGMSSISQRLNVQPASTPSRPVDAATAILEDPRLRLNRYAEAKNLPLPVYKDLPTKNRNIYSSVTVDKKKYSSYPKEAKTKDEAEKLAAQAALDDLIDKDKTPNVITNDKNLITKRILGIVDDHPNGLFESSVIETYIAKYDEGLPKNWLKIVENLVTVDPGANNMAILSPLKDELESRSTGAAVVSEPAILNLNGMDEFWLHIYVVYNTTDIWGVIIDENNSDKIDELAKDMKIFYEGLAPRSPSTPTSGKYYAVFDSDWWHRVRCIKVDSEQIATVFFIDRGDEDEFPTSELRQLDPKFCQLPAQAVQLSMTGLEIFEDCDRIHSFIEDLLLDKNVFVKSMRFEQKHTEGRYMGTVSAQLYLEKDGEEINANELLKEEFLTKIVDPCCNMTPDKVAQQAHISYVSREAIYVQVKSHGLKYLETFMADLTKDYLNNCQFKPRPLSRFDVTKIYVTKNPADNNWYRVKIIKIDNDNQAQVFCIDVGNTLIVKKSNLILLEDLSELLTTYPSQAVQIKLHKISPLMFDQKMVSHLQELAPKTDVFYMKVQDNSHNKPPVVEFYKRLENNYLASLNDTLALEPEISKDDNNNAKPRTRNDRSSLGARSEFPLKAPSIPSVGAFFDVHITMAAHPGNFTVQPLNTAHALEKLMVELSKVCNSYTGPPLTPSSVKVGNMFAAKYDDDGRWYRAYVSKIISKTVCAVYFCDYGDYRAVSLEHLQPLQNQFYDLPYQAIKAKLYGITPKLKGDWTVKDTLRFNELIVAKSFVSIVKSCDMDNMSSGETILSLELIDTSTSEDIYISNILVNEKRAEKLEEL